MRLVDRNIKFIACGASNYKPDNAWIDWNDYVLQRMAGNIDYLSVHRYVREALGSNTNFPGMMSVGLDIDQKIEIVKALIAKAMAKSGTKRPIYLSFDEWSGGGPGTGNTLTGSLTVAQHLNSFIRHADIVKMANITMLSSLVGNSPEGDFKTRCIRHSISIQITPMAPRWMCMSAAKSTTIQFSKTSPISTLQPY